MNSRDTDVPALPPLAGGTNETRGSSRRFGSSKGAALLRSPLCIVWGILLAVGVLGGLRLSESSVAMYNAGAPDPGRIVGRPRPIRSDEWWVRLPMLVRQDVAGFPGSTATGLGSHDLGTVYNVPVWSADAIIRPHALLYFALPLEIAYSTEWWLSLALPVIGVYLLFLHSGLKRLSALLCASILALNPIAHWWNLPDQGFIFGYGAIGAALLLTANQTMSRLRRIALAISAGWFLACSAASLYVPMIIPMSILVGVLYLAKVATVTDRRSEKRRLAIVNTCVGLCAAAALIGAFVLRHRAALATIGGTVYPGTRSVDGGTGSLELLLSAPFNRLVSVPLTGTVNGANTSEASAGLLLWLPATVILSSTFRQRARRSHWRVAFIVYVAVTAFLAWYCLPLPRALGQLVLFDRVPAQRMLFGIAFGSVIAFGLSLRTLQHARVEYVHKLSAALSFYALTVVVGSHLMIDDSPIGRLPLFLLPLPVAIGITLAMGKRQALGLGAIVVFMAWSAAFVNPLQRGLDPLLDHPLRRSLLALRRQDPSATVLLMDLDPVNIGAAESAGLPVIGGANFFPDADAWKRFDPGKVDQQVWNRYASVFVTRSEPAMSGSVTLTQTDTVLLKLSPCDSRLSEFDVRFIVTLAALPETCVRELERVAAGETTVLIYRVG